MAAYNRLIVAGNLTRDPEIRYVDGGGKSVTQFDLAVNGRKDKEPLFLRIIAWEDLGERCNQYLKKGSGALVEGRLEVRKYETNGEKRLAVECVASNVQFLDGGNRNSDHGSSDEPLAGNGKGEIGRQSSSGSRGAGRSRASAPSHEEDEIPW